MFCATKCTANATDDVKTVCMYVTITVNFLKPEKEIVLTFRC